MHFMYIIYIYVYVYDYVQSPQYYSFAEIA